MRVAVIPERCVGCRVCELVCSERHEGVFHPSRSRIRVLSFDETVQDIPIVCQQCPDAPCLAACPSGALSRNTKTGAVVVDPELCTQCQTCVEACAIGERRVKPDAKLAIRFESGSQAPQKCDLCGGDPQCVKFCPTEALLLTDLPASSSEVSVAGMENALALFLRQEEPVAPRQGGK
jgi:carbon-monoxide dehydrogenase iron sulfur subunit